MAQNTQVTKHKQPITVLQTQLHGSGRRQSWILPNACCVPPLFLNNAVSSAPIRPSVGLAILRTLIADPSNLETRKSIPKWQLQRKLSKVQKGAKPEPARHCKEQKSFMH